jgi:hypothetical protein
MERRTVCRFLILKQPTSIWVKQKVYRTMSKIFSRIRTTVVMIPMLIGVCAFTTGAALGISWKKNDVIPVVLVKPGIGGFEPIEEGSIGNTWRKSDVKPVLLVKPGIGGFEPREGSTIGNRWSKDELVPVMLVEPSIGGFIPLRMLSSDRTGSSDGATAQALKDDEKSTENAVSPSVIESKIDGDFEGWEGETIVKLMNGQIWQQSEYHYHYHFAFMPKVLIFKSGGGYKMKVDGVEKAVGVKRLK